MYELGKAWMEWFEGGELHPVIRDDVNIQKTLKNRSMFYTVLGIFCMPRPSQRPDV